MQTPWGKADSITTVAPGVICIGTPSHGGYYVANAVRMEWPANLRSYVPFAGEGWYEEDCDWAVVALAMPHLFPAEALEIAHKIIARGHCKGIEV